MNNKLIPLPFKRSSHRQIVDVNGHLIVQVYSGGCGIEAADEVEELVVRACNEYDELKLKATHYEWLLNEARKTGVTVRFVNGGKDMCVSGGIIKESLVDDLVTALEVAKKELTHDVPGSCYATGPLTGNYIEDLIVCPGCRAIEQIDAALAKAGAA